MLTRYLPITIALSLALAACQTPESTEGSAPAEAQEPEASVAEIDEPDEPGEPDEPTETTETDDPTEAMADHPDPPETTAHTDCIAALNDFAFHIYRAQTTAEPNKVISPASIALAMNMVLLGAGGNTADELATALSISLDPDADLHGCWQRTRHRWIAFDDHSGVEFAIANRLFGEETLTFSDDYIGRARDHYDAPLQSLPLRADSEASRSTINSWVAEITRDRIPEILPPRSIDRDTTLVLVNAMYLLADWQHQFPPNRTRDQRFRRTDGSRISVPMMSQVEDFPYTEVDGVQVLELPYEGGDLSMVILLPHWGGLDDIEAELTGDGLNNVLEELSDRKVSVQFPRFKLEPPVVDLIQTFRALGVRDLFDLGRADLSAILGDDVDEALAVDAIYHQTFIEVDEEGTEAAAATAVTTARGISSGPTPVHFRADRPFLFLIRDRSSGAILFLGRVDDPS